MKNRIQLFHIVIIRVCFLSHSKHINMPVCSLSAVWKFLPLLACQDECCFNQCSCNDCRTLSVMTLCCMSLGMWFALPCLLLFSLTAFALTPHVFVHLNIVSQFEGEQKKTIQLYPSSDKPTFATWIALGESRILYMYSYTFRRSTTCAARLQPNDGIAAPELLQTDTLTRTQAESIFF